MSLRESIEGLGPYPSLFSLALPAATVEPLKLLMIMIPWFEKFWKTCVSIRTRVIGTFVASRNCETVRDTRSAPK